MSYFEDLKLGSRRELGSYEFTAERIVSYGERFDPHPFHLSDEAGKASPFGGLCASIWHVGCGFMLNIVRRTQRDIDEAIAAGKTFAPNGPSPGMRNIKLVRPVLAGDTVTYSAEIVGLRESASRPEWGIMESFVTGTNQRGEVVFTSLNAAFMPRRPRTP
jgi:acyl dehydratase